MQNKVQIENVRFIKNNSKGETINLIVLDLANGKPSIVRKVSMFLVDLENSHLIGDRSAISITGSKFRSILMDLEGGQIRGDFKYHKAGDEWTLNEDHPMLHDSNHPLFGKHQAGDKMTYKKDGTSVEGFLNLSMPRAVRSMYIQAEAIAELTVMAQNAFGATPSFEAPTETVENPHVEKPSDNNGGGSGFNPDEIDQDVIDNATK